MASSSSSSVRAVSAALAFAAASLVAWGPLGCDGDDSTTGRRVTFELTATGSPEAKGTFTNVAGWSVTLSRAVVSVGPTTFYDGPTLFSRSPRLSLVPVAHAHPGHYVPGEAKGQIFPAATIDLRGEPVVVGRGEGISGMLRSATFTFGEPIAGEAAGTVAVVDGEATRSGERKTFHVVVAREDVTNAKGAAAVEGCPFEPVEVQGDGLVTLTIRPERWLEQVDFGADEAVVRNAVVRGMKAATPYSFAFTPAPAP